MLDDQIIHCPHQRYAGKRLIADAPPFDRSPAAVIVQAGTNMDDITYIDGKPFTITNREIVTYPVKETEAERKAREKLRLPAPTFSFTIGTLK